MFVTSLWPLFIFIYSWSPLPEHIPRVPSVYLPGCACVPDDPQSHRLCLLWDPKVEEPGRPPTEQTADRGTCTSTGLEEPHCFHGGLWNRRPFCPAPENSRFHGWVYRRPGQLFRGSSSVLLGFVHGGPVEETDQIHSRHTDSTHYSQTVSEINSTTKLHVHFVPKWFDYNCSAVRMHAVSV